MKKGIRDNFPGCALICVDVDTAIVDWIYPWIGLNWIGWDDCGPVFKSAAQSSRCCFFQIIICEPFPPAPSNSRFRLSQVVSCTRVHWCWSTVKNRDVNRSLIVRCFRVTTSRWRRCSLSTDRSSSIQPEPRRSLSALSTTPTRRLEVSHCPSTPPRCHVSPNTWGDSQWRHFIYNIGLRHFLGDRMTTIGLQEFVK